MPERIEQAQALSWAGATIEEIAAYFGVPVSTLYNWGTKFPAFLEAIRVGKEHADERVKSSLYHRANAGSDTAAIFWLKNRQPKEWRDKQDIELSGGLDITDKLGTREMALAMLQTMREAMEDTRGPDMLVIDESPPSPTAETADYAARRMRRRFE